MNSIKTWLQTTKMGKITYTLLWMVLTVAILIIGYLMVKVQK